MKNKLDKLPKNWLIADKNVCSFKMKAVNKYIK
jgi:hypothetical protein